MLFCAGWVCSREGVSAPHLHGPPLLLSPPPPGETGARNRCCFRTQSDDSASLDTNTLYPTSSRDPHPQVPTAPQALPGTPPWRTGVPLMDEQGRCCS